MPARSHSGNWLNLTCLVLVLAGCEKPSHESVASLATTAASEPTAVELKFATWDEIEKVATASGRVTVVDLWSLSCAPCLKEFPGLVRLDQQFGEVIQCIGVDVDYDGRKTRPPETYEDRVSEFLGSVGAGFSNYISTTPSDDIYRLVEIDSIPTVLVYGSDGKLAKKFVDAGETAGFTYEKDVLPLVTSLVE